MDSKHKIIIAVLVAIIMVLAGALAMIVLSPSDIQTDILQTKGCTLNASHFAEPLNENGVFEIIDTASSTDIAFSTIDKEGIDNVLNSWRNGALTARSYQIAGLNGLLTQDLNSNGLTFYFEKNGQYYMISSIAESSTDNGNIQMDSFRGLSILAEFNEIITAWQNGMPSESNVDITQDESVSTESASTESQSAEYTTSQPAASSDDVREEDQITSDGWNPKEHEVSREQLDDGNERVNYDDGYFRIVDKDGNIITYGY